jgi:hypothetical protein
MKLNYKNISISDAIAFLTLLVGITLAVVGFRLTTASNNINDTLRRETLDTRNVATYQRYEDLFWSDNPVSESRAVAFFRKDGNKGYQCQYIYAQFVEAQGSIDPKQKSRIETHLASIFGPADIEATCQKWK